MLKKLENTIENGQEKTLEAPLQLSVWQQDIVKGHESFKEEKQLLVYTVNSCSLSRSQINYLGTTREFFDV